MKLKTSGVDAWSGTGDQLPPGSYVVKVVSAEEATSKNGNPQVVVDLQVAEGDFAGAEIRDWITITEASMGRVVQALQGLGIDTSRDVDLDVGELVGRRAEVVVREDTYVDRQGETRTSMKVKGYRPVSRASDVPSDFPEGQAPANGKKNDDGQPLPF